MSGSAPFRLNQTGLMLAMVSAAFTGEAGAVAGRVDFATAGATVSGPDGRERPLVKGAELDNGDTVNTKEGRAQVRFTDGSFVSLQPNTEFGIKEYRYENKTDGTETGFFSLVKGAMRTVTGAIGRVNRNRYQINTPTATVGIRGTGGLIQVLSDGSTLVLGTSGIWTISNPAGTIDVPAGTSGTATPKTDSAPQRTSQAPEAGPAPTTTTTTTFSSGEERTSSGSSATVPATSLIKPLLTGTGYRVAMVHTSFTPFGGSTTGVSTFNSVGQLTEIRGINNDLGYALNTGSHADFASDGILAWGRWTGSTLSCGECGTNAPTGIQSYGSNEGLHYVIGMPTATLPTSGSGTYSLMGATSPTLTSGAGAPGTVTGGSLDVGFGSGSYTVNLVGFTVAMPSISRTYVMSGGTTVCGASSAFSFSPSVSGCATTCSSSVAGFFSGASAERAGISYLINESSNNVIGAAAFKK